MIFFIDASALVKLYLNERGSHAMEALFARAGQPPGLYISDLTELEVLVTLAKRGRTEGRKGRRTYLRALERFADHRRTLLSVVSLSPGHVREARGFATRYPDSGAGTLDLVHAASARGVEARVPGGPLVFVVADRKLRALAERIGFRTLDPETEPA